jgi:hypothetical protein
MRRRSRLTSRLGNVALAYVLALQTLLGAWAGHAGVSTPGAIDPSLTLCRTASAGETQKSDGEKGSPAHCVVMCLSGGCGAGDPPATVAVAAELLPLRTGAISIRAVADSVAAAAQHIALNARGPPSIG